MEGVAARVPDPEPDASAAHGRDPEPDGEEACHTDDTLVAMLRAAAGDFVVEWQLASPSSHDSGRVSCAFNEICRLVPSS